VGEREVHQIAGVAAGERILEDFLQTEVVEVVGYAAGAPAERLTRLPPQPLTGSARGSRPLRRKFPAGGMFLSWS
jgi:hypothetical protein